jgi:metallo-beta-lactamase family protein
MLGVTVPVRAAIRASDRYSAHADRGEILRWLGGFRRPPDMTYVVHGAAAAAPRFATGSRAGLAGRPPSPRTASASPSSGRPAPFANDNT